MLAHLASPEEVEDFLLSRFLRVINEKKRRIVELEAKLYPCEEQEEMTSDEGCVSSDEEAAPHTGGIVGPGTSSGDVDITEEGLLGLL